jgi:recombinational DNA repair protein RecR
MQARSHDYEESEKMAEEDDNESEMRYCAVCGNSLKEDEPDICYNCQASILINPHIPPDL